VTSAWRRRDWALAIFDCDGVLVDSEPIASRILAEAVSELGFPLSAKYAVENFTGLSLATVLNRIEAQWGRSLPTDFRVRLREHDYAAFRAELQAIDGVAAALGRLGLPRCVASSGTPEKIRLTLGVTGLLQLFEPHLFSAEMVAHGKPAPDLFLLAADRMGVAPQDCIVIEDSVAGIRGAVAAGMTAVGFAGGGHAGPEYAQMLEEAGASAVLDRMADLPRLLQG
jgi:HAD superfamily hydrolase (TIGR01509 family)